jgi:hypothetical protein
MKILILSEGRTGSYSVMEWIRESLGLEIIGESVEYDYIGNDNYIFKRTLSNNNFDLNDIKYFDKVIVLYREDTLEQAESNVYAILKQKWHHNFKTNDGFYELDEDFLIKNRKEIWDAKYSFDNLNEQYKNINKGIKLTYEDIFIKNIGQEIIEKYIEFKSNIVLNNEVNKLRKDNKDGKINFLKKEVDLLNIEIKKHRKNIIDLNNNINELNEYFNDKFSVLNTNVENLNDVTNNLKKIIKSTQKKLI